MLLYMSALIQLGPLALLLPSGRRLVQLPLLFRVIFQILFNLLTKITFLCYFMFAMQEKKSDIKVWLVSHD